MEKEGQRYVIQYLWMKGRGSRMIREALIITLGNGAGKPLQTKS
jgi:hypothetical protein